MSNLKEKDHLEGAADFLHQAIKGLASLNTSVRVLDFGCGAGQLVKDFLQYGYDAYGSDPFITDADKLTSNRLSKTQINPYQLPFEDNYFDIVVSTSVLEHAQNKEECFKEIYRVLKPGGYAMHLFPGKWYLPSEPHIYVPLVNWFWPNCPKWWLMLWAALGVKNEFQKNLSWREVYRTNEQYCKQGLSYRSTQYYENLSMSIFKNFTWPMFFFINHAGGGLNKILKKLPLQSFLGAVSKNFRMGFLVNRKEK